MDLNRLLRDPTYFKIVSFFHENPASIDTPRGVAAWTGENKQNVNRALLKLEKLKILTAHKVSSTTAYCYTRNIKLTKSVENLLKRIKKEE